MKKHPEQLTLGELIKKLEAVLTLNGDKSVMFDFCNFCPGSLMSYRGYYSDLAFTYDHNDKRPKVSELLEECKKQIGSTHTGYKGGDFDMDEDTPLWVSDYGDADSTIIVNVKDDGYTVYLETRHIYD